MLNMVNTTGMEEIELYIEVVRVKPQVNQYVGGYTDLFVPENYNVAEFDYGCGPSSGPSPDIDRCGIYANDEDCEYDEANVESDEDVDDESNGDLDVQADGHVSFFKIFNQVLENEQRIYVSAHAAFCDVSNNLDAEEPDELSPVHYHLPPSHQFEHVQNFSNVISNVLKTGPNWTGRFDRSDRQPATKPVRFNAKNRFLIELDKNRIKPAVKPVNQMNRPVLSELNDSLSQFFFSS